MRQLLYIGTILLTFVSGWGNVLAATLCPRLQGHDCCFSKKAEHKHHPGSSPRQTAAGDVETSHSSSDIHENRNAANLGKPAESCSHCASHSEATNAPAAFTSERGRGGRDFNPAPPAAFRPFALSSQLLAQRVTAREHAPPGTSTPRHVLVNIFLI